MSLGWYPDTSAQGREGGSSREGGGRVSKVLLIRTAKICNDPGAL